jgi:LPS export ABC transporter protein LptC
MIARIAMVLTIAAVIAGSILLGRARQPPVSTVKDAATSTSSSYAARDAEIIETGADGRPLYTLQAELIEQRPGDSTVQLEKVEMDYRDGSGNRWRVRARSGVILEDATRVELEGNVNVAGTPPGEYTDAEITTEKLSFDTRRDIVATSEPVKVRWSGRELSARGLVANLKDRSLRLESDVHGSFTPQ